ncbi:MAG: cupredoxin domain-containing protein [Actinomycetota bacterium]|nr:cupredoxin domain-containing protein [Actinomycetota bacterium]
MRTLTKLAVPLLASLGLMGVLTACGSSTTSTPTNDSTVAPSSSPAATTSDTSAATSTDTVTISGFAFSPANVKAGQNVTVTNADSVEHTVTIASAGVDVKVPANGSASFTAPAKAGNYALTCDFHPSMSGTLVVTA